MSKKSKTLDADVVAILEEDRRRHEEQLELFRQEAPSSSPFVRPPWFRLRSPTYLYGESKTVQSERDLCDVNNVVNRYARTGEFPPVTRPPVYMDVSPLQGDLTSLKSRSDDTLRTAQKNVESRTNKKEEASPPPPPSSPPPLAE